MPERIYTTAEAAQVLGRSVCTIRWLCRQGVFGTKRGRDWIITQSELDAYTPRPRGGYRGRKRKEPPSK